MLETHTSSTAPRPWRRQGPRRHGRGTHALGPPHSHIFMAAAEELEKDRPDLAEALAGLERECLQAVAHLGPHFQLKTAYRAEDAAEGKHKVTTCASPSAPIPVAGVMPGGPKLMAFIHAALLAVGAEYKPGIAPRGRLERDLEKILKRS